MAEARERAMNAKWSNVIKGIGYQIVMARLMNDGKFACYDTKLISW